MKSNIDQSTKLKNMRQAGKIVAQIIRGCQEIIKVGATPLDLEKYCLDQLVKHNAQASFKGYKGYRYATCISVNEYVVHTPPNARKFKANDIVSVDIGVEVNGFHADHAWSYLVDPDDSSPNYKIRKKLLDTTLDSLNLGIALIKPGVCFGDVQSKIQETIEDNGYFVVKDLSGHGIGSSIHEPPQFPNYGKKGTGKIFVEGMTIAIEPIVGEKTGEIVEDADGWGIKTADGSLSAHFEHTIIVTDNGVEVITK